MEIWYKELDITLDDYRKISSISQIPADQKNPCYAYHLQLCGGELLLGLMITV
jgi:hypothetical protein